MLDHYEQFKKDIFALTKIDLNAYKEKQMRRRIDTLIGKNKIDSYEKYVALIKSDKDKFEQFGWGGIPETDQYIREAADGLECRLFDRRRAVFACHGTQPPFTVSQYTYHCD